MTSELDKAVKEEEFQRSYSDNIQQQLQAEQQIHALENLVRTKLTKRALERYGNLKAAYPERAVQLLVILARYIQSQNIVINDSQLKEILRNITPKKREFKLTRK